ncbi:MFS transporter [Solirubrobacter phytolaccae]|uniref:MFS transporter n=1 Tax=Solirubrobacter phytolaccae TaxID=1404360 RepID=A0A9X3NCU9_9ACTN|nr:MFS transporter [Solirubrobacter phytolaccae]MDA0183751.1 MFS transporter [Solirubrobacter phytolaccae]
MTTLQRWTMTAVLAATAILMLDIAVVNTALPTLQADLDTDLHALKWVLDAYTLALASIVLTAGSLADRFGRRRLFTLGVIVFTVSSAAAAASGSIELLIATRAVQGLGAALMFAVTLALLSDVFRTPQERTGAFAAYGATIGASFALGPVVGGLLTEALSWEWVFIVNVPIGLVVLAITATKLAESRDPNPPAIDWAGQVTLVAGLFGLVYGLLGAAEHGWGETQVVVALAGGVALLVAFVVIEATSRAPMMPLGFFRQRGFAAAQLAATAISAGLFSTFIYIMLYLQEVLGYSPVEAGAALVPGMFMNLLFAALTAKLAPRLAPGRLIVVGMTLVAVGMALISVVDADSTWLDMQPGFMLAMAGTGLFNATASALSLDVPPHQAGLATGIHDTARQAGLAIGIAALGTLVTPADFVSGFQHVLLVGAGVAAFGAVASFFLLRTTGPRAAVAAQQA